MKRNKEEEIEAARMDFIKTVSLLYPEKALDMRLVETTGAYWHGFRCGMLLMHDQFPVKGKEKPYYEAEMRLATASVRNAEMYASNRYTIHYRNHEYSKSGKLTKVEAYFVKEVRKFEEVK